MRILWFNTDNTDQPLTVLHDTSGPTFTKDLQFPLEILDHIISYLPRSSLPNLASVCRFWYAAAMPVLYSHIYIRTLPHWRLFVRTMTQDTFSQHFGSCIRSIVLKPSPRLIPAQLTSALNQSVIENDDILQPTLRGYARLERVNYDLTGLERLDRPWLPDVGGEETENYEEIDSSQKESEWLSHVRDEETDIVLRQCSQLAYLDLSGCEHLTDKTLFALASGKSIRDSCPLIGLWFSLMREVTSQGIQALLQSEKKNKNGSKLKHLDISFLVNLRDQSIKEMMEQWGPSLRHLRLNSIYELSDTAAISISHYCKQLELLYMTRCWKLTNTSMRLLGYGCPLLRYVSVAYLTFTDEDGIKHFMHACRSLIWLDISGCSINSLFKPAILASWEVFRRRHQLGLVTINDRSMHSL